MLTPVSQDTAITTFSLPTGEVVIIDTEEWERVKRFSWHKVVDRRYYRISAYVNGRIRQLHRFILGVTSTTKLLRIDNNWLNNTKANLILGAVRPKSIPAGSKFVGVFKRGHGGVYAMCGAEYLGSYKTEEEAARAYDTAAIRRYGPLATLNFPIQVPVSS